MIVYRSPATSFTPTAELYAGDAPRAFIEFSKQGCVEDDVPNGVVDFFKRHVVPRQRMAEKQALRAPAQRPGRGHAPNCHVPGIYGCRVPFGIRTRRGHPPRCGRVVAERLVRSFMVVPTAKYIEPLLLRA